LADIVDLWFRLAPSLFICLSCAFCLPIHCCIILIVWSTVLGIGIKPRMSTPSPNGSGIGIGTGIGVQRSSQPNFRSSLSVPSTPPLPLPVDSVPTLINSEFPGTPHTSSTHSISIATLSIANALKESGKAEAPLVGTPSTRQVRSTMKIKSREIVKPSQAVYESSDGPLIRVTLKAALAIFQTKIAEPNPSNEGMYQQSNVYPFT
jgi:hypothetical protein